MISRKFAKQLAADAERRVGVKTTAGKFLLHAKTHGVSEDDWTDGHTLTVTQDDVLLEIDALTDVANEFTNLGRHPRISERLTQYRAALTSIQKQITAGNGAPQEAVSTKGSETTMSKDTSPSPAAVFGGNPNVKRASAQYDGGTNKRFSYPDGLAARLKFGPERAGRDMVIDGRPAYEPNQRQRAMVGAWWKHKVASMHKMQDLLSDHDKDLYHELVTTGEWVGDIRDGNGLHEYLQPKLLSDLHRVRKGVRSEKVSGTVLLTP